jgi:hypothetical protein
MLGGQPQSEMARLEDTAGTEPTCAIFGSFCAKSLTTGRKRGPHKPPSPPALGLPKEVRLGDAFARVTMTVSLTRIVVGELL